MRRHDQTQKDLPTHDDDIAHRSPRPTAPPPETFFPKSNRLEFQSPRLHRTGRPLARTARRRPSPGPGSGLGPRARACPRAEPPPTPKRVIECRQSLGQHSPTRRRSRSDAQRGLERCRRRALASRRREPGSRARARDRAERDDRDGPRGGRRKMSGAPGWWTFSKLRRRLWRRRRARRRPRRR